MSKYITRRDFNRIVKRVEHNIKNIARVDRSVAKDVRTLGRSIRKDAQNILIDSNAVFRSRLLNSIAFRMIKKTRRRLTFSYIADVPYSSWIEERIPRRKNVRVTREIQDWYRFQQHGYGFKMNLRGGGRRTRIYVPRLGTLKVYRLSKHNHRGVGFMKHSLEMNESKLIKTTADAFTKDVESVYRKIII